jgi:hypothetical protein
VRHARQYTRALISAFHVLAVLAYCSDVRAQAGPPYLTNDPGTPGNGNWEINVASIQTIARGVAVYQLPQIDLNFGLGERIQLTYEVPYVLQSSAREPLQSGWGNAYTGIKWRFLDQGEDGWQMSTFPQWETAGSRHGQATGIAGPGPRVLLPVEVARNLGSIGIDFEAGYYVPGHGPRERILGFVVGKSVTDRLELDAEFYDDRAYHATPRSSTIDLGGRYKLCPGIIALFMAGRSINGFGLGQPEFMAYLGIQLLLSDYGRAFNPSP